MIAIDVYVNVNQTPPAAAMTDLSSPTPREPGAGATQAAPPITATSP